MDDDKKLIEDVKRVCNGNNYYSPEEKVQWLRKLTDRLEQKPFLSEAEALQRARWAASEGADAPYNKRHMLAGSFDKIPVVQAALRALRDLDKPLPVKKDSWIDDLLMSKRVQVDDLRMREAVQEAFEAGKAAAGGK